MRKSSIFIIFFLLSISLFYFLSSPGANSREKIWFVLDKDAIHFNQESYFSGWIWTETEDTVMGKKEKGDLFTVQTHDIERIEKNKLFEKLKNIL
jgi:hypothetical protein